MEAINLFADYELLPEEPRKLLEQFEEATNGEPDYNNLSDWLEKFNSIGYTFDWYLDACPYALTTIKFFDKLKNLYESGDLVIPLGEPEGNTAHDYTWTSIVQGYYTFKGGDKVNISLGNLLGEEIKETQFELFNEMVQTSGINIVHCNSCDALIFHRKFSIEDNDHSVICMYCNTKQDTHDCSDYYSEENHPDRLY